MKRTSIILTGLIFMTLFGLKTYAQSDDVYYDPNTQKESPNNSQDYSQRNTERTYNDGYNSQSSRQKGSKTYVDSDGNTINNNNYNDDPYYSTQLERFYGPSCGLGYYDYAYTPAYYWGWGGLGLGYGGYYGGSYWGWNTGWGLCGYYNPFYSPFGIYGFGYGYYGYGYGRGYGYGGYYGRGYGYGGYYGRGYGEGYGNRYYGATATNRYSSEPMHREARAEDHSSAMENNTAHSNNLGNPTEGKNNGYKPTGNVPQNSAKGAKATNQNNGGWKQVEPQGWSNAGNNNAARNGNSNNSGNANNGGNRGNRGGNVQQGQQSQHSQGQYGNSSQQRGGNYGQNQGNHYSQPQQRSSAPAQSYHGGYSGGSSHSSGGGGGSHSSGGGGGSHGGGGGRH